MLGGVIIVLVLPVFGFKIRLVLDRVVSLFAQGSLHEQLNLWVRSVTMRVDSIPKGQFLAATEQELIDNLLPSFLAMPIVLHEDKKEMEEFEVSIDVNDFGEIIKTKGILVDVSIPFTGGDGFWALTPTTHFPNSPRGYVQSSHNGESGTLHVIKEQAIHLPIELLKSEIEHETHLIRTTIANQQNQIEGFNKSLPGQLSAAFLDRRRRLELHNTVPDLLGIPLKRKDGAPSFAPVGIARKLIRPLPVAPVLGVPAEPGIAEGDYQHILDVIRHEGRTFETTPRTYAVHDEEELRDIMLAHLNGHYTGEASGEAFRKIGKTDIKIESGNRAAFVSEFKIWRGGKEFIESINQLLGYLTWRDSKAALVIFNKENAKFSEILAKIPDALKSHPKVKGEIVPLGNGEWKIQLSSLEDEDRLVTVTVFAFDLFVQPNAKKGS